MARIAIVEDMLKTRVALKEILISAGHKIIAEFGDGFEALSVFREDDILVDLVILDYNIKTYIDAKPYTGLELLDDIKKIKSNVKVVFVSAFAEKDIIKQAIVKGASDFIVKPFEAKDLIDRVNKALQKII